MTVTIQTTVKLWASRGATPRYITCVWGKPRGKRSGGPDPDERVKIVVSPVETSAAAKPSSISVPSPPVSDCVRLFPAYAEWDRWRLDGRVEPHGHSGLVR